MPEHGLAFPNIDPVALQIGPLSIHWYALSYIAGLLLGWYYARRLVANASLWRTPPGDPALLDDLLAWVALGVIIGGRLGMFLWEPSTYLENPIRIFKVWEGGMAFHGGLIGATLAVILFARHHRLPVASYLDVVAAAAPIGLFFGRIANFVNGELWGRPTTVPWGFVFPHADEQVRHPSQLYEAGLEGIALFVILAVMIRFGALKRPGLVCGVFAIGYCIARSIGEIFREPDAIFWGPITMGQAYSLPMLIAGIGFVAFALTRRPADA